MTDKATLITRLAEAWEQTDIPQTQFAMMLREEADLYDEAPELASDSNRPVNGV
ncbi:MAG: hypothetical protein ABEI86_10355 [Halobacteriaceae archaeon]